MAFMGRGSGPSLGNNMSGGLNNDSSGTNRRHYSRFFWRPYRYIYYIPLDNTYVIMQIILTFIILIVGVITYVFTYKSTIIDPIEGMKKLFLNSYSIIILVLLIFNIIAHFFSKNKKILMKIVIIILVISIVLMIIFLGIKLNFDATYNDEKFEQFYEEQNIKQDSNIKSKVHIGLNGIYMKTEKDFYIDESRELYNIFKIKSYGLIGIHLLFNVLIIYQILKLTKIQEKREQLDKDDLILFDEEKNILI